ncbi:MAG: secondary thiamine-phosphate synthase enzyme YjbQ [Deltaproteobacteria bacterium]|nr:secondary thiamine-phosphate synthase enzyme YjbQ [Deltaproteobacteria bacterium]
MLITVNISTSKREEFVDITAQVKQAVSESGVSSGICTLFVSHTTAAITINEGADPSVKRDMLVYLNKLVPLRGDYRHMEGNSDAHIKTSLMGCSESVIIEKGKLLLGTWQAIYFCEFDGPRSRQFQIKIIGE